MSKAVFQSTLGGSITLDADDSAANKVIAIPSKDGILPVPVDEGLDNQVLVSRGAAASPEWEYLAGVGTVVSVNVSGGTTGLTTSGGPITGSGTITLAGTLAVANGGTGSTTAPDALTALGAYPAANPSGFTNNTGTVTSVGGTGTVNGLTLSGTVTGSGNLTLGGTLSLASPPAIGGTTPAAGTFTTLADVSGSVRQIPQSGSAKTSSYPLTTGDVGEFIQVGSGGSVTIPDATFAAGDAVSVFNNTSGNITITCTITTAYIAGTDADKATVTLATRGVCTILFISGTVCVISGNVT